MAAICTARAGHALPVRPVWRLRTAWTARLRASEPSWSRRLLQTSSSNPPKPPDFAFAFDIDGVLLRSSKPLPGASETLRYLQAHRIPFILLTNGGGKTEAQRVADLSKYLDVPIDESMFVQSHTPFTQLVEGHKNRADLKDACVLVLGGEGNDCRHIAEKYGFENVLTPADLIAACPSLWPLANRQLYTSHARPLPFPMSSEVFSDSVELEKKLRVATILVFHDPCDWALDIQIITDLLLSYSGYLGTLSDKNGRREFENNGYLQDGQPSLWISNPDIRWASGYHLDRLGQGAFLRALVGVWESLTGGAKDGSHLRYQQMGKPSHMTYSFAEHKLLAHRKALLGNERDSEVGLGDVYMVGDNPASDIRGANNYDSRARESPNTYPNWHSILVKTGVYRGGATKHIPKKYVHDIQAAVGWALKNSGWQKPFP